MIKVNLFFHGFLSARNWLLIIIPFINMPIMLTLAILISYLGMVS